MKTTTFKRENGYISVIVCENGLSFIVGNKLFKTKKGAESANNRLKEICGDNYEKRNVPMTTTLPDGSININYHYENRVVV